MIFIAAKGSILKQEIMNKILAIFPESFLYNDGKELRINGFEEGNPLQIKCVLTCAKTPVQIEKSVASEDSSSAGDLNFGAEETEDIPFEPTQQEKENLKNLLNSLGF